MKTNKQTLLLSKLVLLSALGLGFSLKAEANSNEVSQLSCNSGETIRINVLNNRAWCESTSTSTIRTYRRPGETISYTFDNRANAKVRCTSGFQIERVPAVVGLGSGFVCVQTIPSWPFNITVYRAPGSSQNLARPLAIKRCTLGFGAYLENNIVINGIRGDYVHCRKEENSTVIERKRVQERGISG